jgi:uncharacterized membrane protein YbaN (DUF454 family)
MRTSTALLGFATAMMGACEMNSEKWKQDILDEWEKSKNYPRKKKKKIRKHLQLDWNFACWSPFDDLMNKKF